MPENSFFERYARIVGKELPDPSTLSLDEKCLLASRLVAVGETKKAIAEYLGVSRQTVYAYLARIVDEQVQELENKTYLTKYVERINELELQREYYRRILENVREAGDIMEVDEKSGKEIPKTSHIKNLAEIGRLIRDYDRMILEIEQVVGFIPKHNPSELFYTLKDQNPKTVEAKEDNYELLSEEEMDRLLLSKLQRRPPQLGNALSNIKDESII